jgi:quinol-cytochrome oxidoreductase complex cytochrome b subunit
VVFFLIAMYVLVVFFFVVDVLRQRALSGVVKALVIVAFFVLPVASLIVYGFWRMRQSRGLPGY